MASQDSTSGPVTISANIQVFVGDLLLFTDKARTSVRKAVPKQDRTYEAVALNTASIGQELQLIASEEPVLIPAILGGAP